MNGGFKYEIRYDAWGAQRYSSGTVGTTLQYTDQRKEASLGGSSGLYFYNARYYDPYITRFTQPDSIIPDPFDPLSFDRYAYVRNNPINYSDPSGHIFTSCTNNCTTPLFTIDLSGIYNRNIVGALIVAPALEAMAAVGCVVVGCHVDLATHQIVGPTRAETANNVPVLFGDVIFDPFIGTGGVFRSELDSIRLLDDNVKGYAYEDWLRKVYGGGDRVFLDGTEFDTQAGNTLIEGKSSGWSSYTPTNKDFSDFQNQIGREFAIAAKNGYQFVLHMLDRPPQFVIDWLEKKGYPFVIDSEK